MRIGLVDVDTSHPQNWIPILRDLGHEVVGICDAGDVHPAEYVRDFAAEHAVSALYGTLDAMVDDVDCAIVHACDWRSGQWWLEHDQFALRSLGPTRNTHKCSRTNLFWQRRLAVSTSGRTESLRHSSQLANMGKRLVRQLHLAK